MSDHDQPVASNLLNREFEASAPNQRWVGDTTELPTASGKFYLAAIVDPLRPVRRRVGGERGQRPAPHPRRARPGAAPPVPGGRPAPSLRPGQHVRERGLPGGARAHGITCSMSRRGNCHDNAAMESWFSTFKFELGETFASIRHGKDEAFTYIEAFYNQRRRHSSLGYLAPAEYERRFRDSQRQAAA
ncbi:MAG: transposase [Kofleriaceae bacterium]|nr:transposase [Kofleriaceae bacterium]